MGTLQRRGMNGTRIAGLALIIGGAVSLFAYPYDRTTLILLFSSPNMSLVFTPLVTCFGAIALVCGMCTVATDRARSLTPERALVAPMLVAIPYAMATYVPSRSDAIPPAPSEVWTPPATPVELAARTLSTSEAGGLSGGLVMMVALFLAIGVATARGQWQSRIVVVGYVLALSVVTGFLRGSIEYTAGSLVAAAVLGIVPAGIGYRTAAPHASSGADSGVSP